MTAIRATGLFLASIAAGAAGALALTWIAVAVSQ